MKRRLLIFWSLAALLAGGWFYWNWERERSQDDVIALAAARYGVGPALVKAVIWRESRFKPGIRGRVGEIGLMQIRPGTALEWVQAEHIRDWSENSLYDRQTNVLVGTWYLGKLLKRYTASDNPAVYALADYNAGRSNVLRWNKKAGATNSTQFLDQVTFPGTRKYVQSILQREKKYRGTLAAR